MEKNQKERVEELRKLLSKDPSADEFVELATLLSEDPKSRGEAREVCFRGLAENPDHLRARLLLARLFYLDRLSEFCLRELRELERRVQTPSLQKLIAAFGAGETSTGSSSPSGASLLAPEREFDPEVDDIVAEVDLDTEFIDALDELDEEEED